MLAKSKNETIECGGCHMVSMLRGDIRGWKPVAIPGGRQIWFCDKSPCQQQHDAILAGAIHGRTPGLNIDAGMMPVVTPEADALRQRVLELEAENEQLRRQSTAPGANSEPQPARPAHIVEQHSEPPKKGKASVHVNDGHGQALCGAKAPEVLKLPEELAFDDRPCDDCVSAWTARRDGKAPPAPSVADVLSSPPSDATEAAPVSLRPPEPERPAIADYTKLPQFTPDLIARINDGAATDDPILMTPSAYPDMDLSKIPPAKLRNGVAAFFKGKRVVWIDRAMVDNRFIGIVFQLGDATEGSGP